MNNWFADHISNKGSSNGVNYWCITDRNLVLGGNDFLLDTMLFSEEPSINGRLSFSVVICAHQRRLDNNYCTRTLVWSTRRGFCQKNRSVKNSQRYGKWGNSIVVILALQSIFIVGSSKNCKVQVFFFFALSTAVGTFWHRNSQHVLHILATKYKLKKNLKYQFGGRWPLDAILLHHIECHPLPKITKRLSWLYKYSHQFRSRFMTILDGSKYKCIKNWALIILGQTSTVTCCWSPNITKVASMTLSLSSNICIINDSYNFESD